MIFTGILLLALPAVFSARDDPRNVAFLPPDIEAAQPPAQEGEAAQPPAQEGEAAQPLAQRAQMMMQRIRQGVRDPQNQNHAQALASTFCVTCGIVEFTTCCCCPVTCGVVGASSVGASAINTCVAASGERGLRERCVDVIPQRQRRACHRAVTIVFTATAVCASLLWALDVFKSPPKVQFNEKLGGFGLWHDKDDTTNPSGKMPSAVSWTMGVGDPCAWMTSGPASGMYPGMNNLQTLSLQTPTIVSAFPMKGGSWLNFPRPVTFIRLFGSTEPFKAYANWKSWMVYGNLMSTNKGTKLPQVIIGDNGQGDALWAAELIGKLSKEEPLVKSVGFINMVTDKPTIDTEQGILGIMSNTSFPEMGKIYVYMNPGHLPIMMRDLKLIDEKQYETFTKDFLDELQQLPVEQQKATLTGSCKQFDLKDLSTEMKDHIDYLNAEQKKYLPEEMKPLME